MDFIFEIFLRGFIANVLGKYSRYLFFLLIGRKKSLEYLAGNSKDDMSNVSHNFINTLIGMLVFLGLVVGIAKIIDFIRFH